MVGSRTNQKVIECGMGYVGHWNRILHNSEQAKIDIVEQGVNTQIGHVYEAGSQVLLRDALLLLCKPNEITLKLPLAAKQQWLKSVQVAINWKTHHKYGQYLSEQWYMATWVIY